MTRRAYTEEEVRQMLRERQGERTQGELAKEIGLPQSNVSRIISGREKPCPTVLRYLGLETGYLETEDAA